MLFKIGVLENFAIFTGNHLCWSSAINELKAWKLATLFKKRLQQRCFPENIAKFLRTAFL